MKLTERIIAGVLSCATFLLVIVWGWMLVADTDAFGEFLSESPHGIRGIFVGTGLFSFFIIASFLAGLAVNRVSPSAFLLLMLLNFAWMLLIEPSLKVYAGIRYRPHEWFADACIGLVLTMPIIVHKMRRKMSNKMPEDTAPKLADPHH